MTRKQKKVLYRIIIAAILTIIITLIPINDTVKGILYLVPYLVIG